MNISLKKVAFFHCSTVIVLTFFSASLHAPENVDPEKEKIALAKKEAEAGYHKLLSQISDPEIQKIIEDFEQKNGKEAANQIMVKAVGSEASWFIPVLKVVGMAGLATVYGWMTSQNKNASQYTFLNQLIKLVKSPLFVTENLLVFLNKCGINNFMEHQTTIVPILSMGGKVGFDFLYHKFLNSNVPQGEEAQFSFFNHLWEVLRNNKIELCSYMFMSYLLPKVTPLISYLSGKTQIHEELHQTIDAYLKLLEDKELPFYEKISYLTAFSPADIEKRYIEMLKQTYSDQLLKQDPKVKLILDKSAEEQILIKTAPLIEAVKTFNIIQTDIYTHFIGNPPQQDLLPPNLEDLEEEEEEEGPSPEPEKPLVPLTQEEFELEEMQKEYSSSEKEKVPKEPSKEVFNSSKLPWYYIVPQGKSVFGVPLQNPS